MATARKKIPHAIQLYGVCDVAKALGCSTQLVRNLRRADKLQGRWLTGTYWAIERRDLLAWIRSHPKRRPKAGNDMSRAREALARRLIPSLNLAVGAETKAA